MTGGCPITCLTPMLYIVDGLAFAEPDPLRDFGWHHAAYRSADADPFSGPRSTPRSS